jgi:hypothetical protein
MSYSPRDAAYDSVTSPLHRGYPSPPISPRDSDESLRALELSDGPLQPPPRRVRSYSMAGLDFQTELLPLSASDETESPMHAEVTEKNIGLGQGALN